MMELQQCTLCSVQLEMAEYFTHGTEVHGIFSCLYCHRQFKFSKELMVHLNREHKVPTQKFSSGAEFLERGGTETSLLCVECNKIFQSDELTTFMKYHAQECRKSTGICPKCGSVLLLSLLGEHIVHCQGSMNVNLNGSTTITTSQLRNRDNSCKYCGKKFSPSKIAAHIRACSVRSTKSFGNLWNSSSNSLTSKNNSVEFGGGGLNSDLLITSTQDKRERSSSVSISKINKSVRKLNNPDSGVAKTTIRRKSQKNLSLSSTSPSSSAGATVVKVNNNNNNNNSWKLSEPLSIAELSSSTSITPVNDDPSSQSTTVTNTFSTKKSFSKKKQLHSSLSSIIPPILTASKNLIPPLLQSLTSPAAGRKQKSFHHQQDQLNFDDDNYDDEYDDEDFDADDDEMEEQMNSKLDPLLLELDDDKRLGILIRELSDKLKDFVSETSSTTNNNTSINTTTHSVDSPSPIRYGLLVNYSLESKTEDDILNDMILQSSMDCAYCRLVRLIRIDKRQLVIHLLSKHSWDLRVLRTPAMVLKSIMESRNHLRSPKPSSDEKIPIKQENVNDSTTTTPIKDDPNNESTTTTETSVMQLNPVSLSEESMNSADSLPFSPPPAQPEEEIKKDEQGHASDEETKLSSFPSLNPSDEESSSSKTTTTNCVVGKEEEEGMKDSVEKQKPEDSNTTLEVVNLPTLTFSSSEVDKQNCSEQTTTTLSSSSSSSVDQEKSFPHVVVKVQEGPTDNDGDVLMNTTNETITDTPPSPSVDKALPASSIDNSSTHPPLLLPEDVKMEIDDDEYSKKMVDPNAQPMEKKEDISSSNNKLTCLVKSDSKERDQVLDLNLQWIDFKLALLQKVFHSHNVVYTFTGEKLGEFGEIPCECLLCGFLADSQKNLFPHWRRIHRSVAMKCTMCKGKFLFAGALYSHLCLGTPEPLTLTEIEDDHEGSSDTIGWRYQCSICENRQLPGFFNYMVHIRSDHNKCELCLETLNTQKDLEHHMKKHKLNHFCWKCSVTYCAKPNFMTHLFWKHGTESVDCSKCLKKKWPHIYHFCVPPDYFVCDVCGLYFTRPKALLVHKRLHTGEKQRKCPKTSCQERFISKKLLQKHLDTAHGKSDTVTAVASSTPDTLLPTDVPAVNNSSNTTMNSSNELKPELSILSKDQDQANNLKESTTITTLQEQQQQQPLTDLNAVHQEDDGTKVGGGQIVNSLISNDKKHSLFDVPDEDIDGGGSSSENVNSLISNDKKHSLFDVPEDMDVSPPSNHSSPEHQPVKPSKPFNLAEIQGPNLSEDEGPNLSEDESDSGKPFQSSSLLLDDLDKMKQSDDSMSPLLPPLDDFNFSVPEIPTFEENHLPEHIIRENAMFSMQHEHDYCQPILGNVNLKRKVGATTNFYGNGHAYHGSGDFNTKISPRPRGRPKKLKVLKPTKKSGKKRRRSSSSSSSSSSSCSSCGSNCSCSSSSSGSSSSSSNSDSSDNEGGRHHHHSSKSKAPIKMTIPKVKTVKGPTSKKLKKNNGSVAVGGKVVNNGEIVKRPRGAPRKYKKAKVPKLSAKAAKEINENIKLVNPVDAEPYILESDLETDDSGSEEIFHQKQLTDIIGSVNPLIDDIWDMGSEKYLLKLVRGVQNLEELRPSPPPPKREEIKYSLINSGSPQSKLKVRNVPIKPLIVKRNVHSNFNIGSFKELTVVPQQKDSFPIISSGGGGVRSFKTSLGSHEKKKNTAVTITRGPSGTVVQAPLLPSSTLKTKIIHKKRSTNVVKRGIPPTFDDSLATFTGHVAVGDDYLHAPSNLSAPPLMSSNSDFQSSHIPTPTNKRGPRGGGQRKSTSNIKVKTPRARKTAVPVAEVAVDPYEKLYCICQCPHDNVSQMIGCDYKGCQYKWFHFECVGILIPPKGKWYCSECREIVRQKRAAAAKVKAEEASKQEIEGMI